MTDSDAMKTGTYHRSGQVVQTPKCAVPVCGYHISPEVKNGVCSECEILIQKILWILDRVNPGPPSPDPEDPKDQKGAFFIPKPGMANAAIKEALAARGHQP